MSSRVNREREFKKFVIQEVKETYEEYVDELENTIVDLDVRLAELESQMLFFTKTISVKFTDVCGVKIPVVEDD